jgi:ubiquinone/menaquinone biosynthesis C-methylase UbiE
MSVPPVSQTLRTYRHSITTAGQASPASLSAEVIRTIRTHFSPGAAAGKLSILDVGCGLGHQMKLIRESLPGYFHRIEGLDWSPATVEAHRRDPDSVYDAVTLCDSGALPFGDRTFEIALSMENLEHLYGHEAVKSIEEMARVAKHVIITTPVPSDCVNFNFTYPEIVEAILDPIPLSERDFICLESTIHKSTVFPQSMKDAGFTVSAEGHGHYFARSDDIRCDRIQCVGIQPLDTEAFAAAWPPPNVDYKPLYVELLARSAAMHDQIVTHRMYEQKKQHSATVRQIGSWLERIVPTSLYEASKRAYKRALYRT